MICPECRGRGFVPLVEDDDDEDGARAVVCPACGGYPPDWPRCPACGDFALDGHITCGRVECNESEWRAERQRNLFEA